MSVPPNGRLPLRRSTSGAKTRTLTVLLAILAVGLGLPTVAANPVDAAPLGAPRSLSVTNQGSSIELSWTPTTPDRVVGYEVYRDGVRIGQPVTGSTAPMSAVGDIALCNSPAQIAGHTATANLADTLPGPIALVGDVVQGNGSWNSFINCFDNQWGRHKDRSFPIPGNHEWNTPGAEPFYRYYGNRAGTPGQGWISYTVGDWRVIGLDTNCWEIEGCAVGSPQYQWLDAELAASTSPCTLVYAHQPRWRNTLPDNAVYLKPLWELMYNHGVELYLAGDQHIYARYGVLDPSGNPDRNGIRQITVGTGGYSHGRFGSFTNPLPEARDRTTFGMLALQLSPTSYNFEFKPASGQGTFSDAGGTGCHGPNSSRVRFVDRGQAGNANTYQVVAYDNAGNRSAPQSISINGGSEPTNPPVTVPTPPTSPAPTPPSNPAPTPPADANAPRGAITAVATPGAGRIAVAGWAFDPDAGTGRVTMTVDGSRTKTVPTVINRPSSGRQDGFYVSMPVGSGNYRVCIRAENIAGDQPATRLGCRDVSVSESGPVGSFLRIVDDPRGFPAAVGWVVDPDTTDPVRVQISVNGRYIRTGQAATRTSRSTAIFPGYGDRHGFWMRLPNVAGPKQVCLWAEDNNSNAGIGLGCRNYN